MSPATKRIWWSTWPGALALGALSLVLVAVTAVTLLLGAVLTLTDVSGTDQESIGGVGLGWRIGYAVLGVGFLAVPAAVVVCARRRWLGWVLVLLGASVAVLGAGQWTLGII